MATSNLKVTNQLVRECVGLPADPAMRPLYPCATRGTLLNDFTIYGLDEHGETTSTERLRVPDRQMLAELGRMRLGKFHAVEIWEGALCVLRLRREIESQA